MEKFEKLGLTGEILNILEKKGFKEPSEIQEKAIPLILSGRDVIGGAATGSGKTLAFLSGMIQNVNQNKNVQGLILTPTRELAEQITSSLTEFSNNRLNVLSVYGGVDIMKQIRKLPRANVVVGTPGRILDHLNRKTLKLDNIKSLVLDEVDRMFDMGFLSSVERILSQCSKDRQTMLFSATVSSDVVYLAKKHAKNPVHVSVKNYLDPSKLKQVYYDASNKTKLSLLIHLLKEDVKDISMVFCNTRRNADFVAKNLKNNKINAIAIHGGLNQSKRIHVLEKFQKKEVQVLVCTDVAARGLDIKGISHVYNYDTPKTSEEYIHRIGRTARAGSNGLAITILSERDYENFRNVLMNRKLKIDEKELPRFRYIPYFITPEKRDFSPRRSVSKQRGYRKKWTK
jgi:ATP-dependent RNA helicase DeaD